MIPNSLPTTRNNLFAQTTAQGKPLGSADMPEMFVRLVGADIKIRLRGTQFRYAKARHTFFSSRKYALRELCPCRTLASSSLWFSLFKRDYSRGTKRDQEGPREEKSPPPHTREKGNTRKHKTRKAHEMRWEEPLQQHHLARDTVTTTTRVKYLIPFWFLTLGHHFCGHCLFLLLLFLVFETRTCGHV